MARYGSSPAHQLNVLGQTLRQGMIDRGNMDLQRAQLEYQMNDPRRLNELAKAQEEIDVRTQRENTPLTPASFLGEEVKDAESLEHFANNILPELDKHGMTVATKPVYEMRSKGEVPEASFYSKTTGKPY